MSGQVNQNSQTTADLVRANARSRPDAPFLFFYDEVITYGELDRQTDALAAYLQDIGVGAGEVVAFMMDNTPWFFFTLLGIQKAGAIACPISCWWQAREVAYLIDDCQPRVMVADPDYLDRISAIKDSIPSVKQILVNSPDALELDFAHQRLEQVLGEYAGKAPSEVEIAPDDVAAVMYTSGTTGQPKGVMLTHRGVVRGAWCKTQHVPISPGEKILCVLPLFHSGGLNDLAFPVLYRGASIVLRRNFSASEFWQCVQRYAVNGFYIVPTMWNILLRIPEADQVDTSSLRLGLSGAAPIPPEQLAECERRFHIPILEAYGSTENTGGITSNQLDQRKAGSVGTALTGLEVAVLDPLGQALPAGEIGEIAVRGETVMKGYLNQPEATAEVIRDGWLYTGDLGHLDQEGFLFLVDRKKDMIIRGGVNVYPQEIENLIATHPAVREVAVIPEPHDKYGQVAKACVVLAPGKECSAEEILAFCRQQMAAYKVPEHIVFRDSLPANAVGKIVKKELIRQLEEEKTDQEVASVAPLFEGMPARFIPENAVGVDAAVSYHITGQGGGKWTVVIKDQTITLRQGLVDEPTALLVARGRDYHDIVMGKLDGITAVMTGKLKIDGDASFMRGMHKMFQPLDNVVHTPKTLRQRLALAGTIAKALASRLMGKKQ